MNTLEQTPAPWERIAPSGSAANTPAEINVIELPLMLRLWRILVRRRRLEIAPMQGEQSLGGLDRDVVALVGQGRGQPCRLPRPLDALDVFLAAPGVEDDEPDESRPHDEPDDEQPPVELGVHRAEV